MGVLYRFRVAKYTQKGTSFIQFTCFQWVWVFGGFLLLFYFLLLCMLFDPNYISISMRLSVRHYMGSMEEEVVGSFLT